MTASGANFERGTKYRCRFGHLGDVNATHVPNSNIITCISPSSLSRAPEKVPVEIALDNVSFSSAGLLFQYTAAQESTFGFIPDLGSISGGGLVTIQGKNMHGGSHY